MQKTKRRTRRKFTRKRTKEVKIAYDLELTVLEILSSDTGYCWDIDDIAEICGISRQAAYHIYTKGCRKARVQIREELPELQQVFPFIA